MQKLCAMGSSRGFSSGQYLYRQGDTAEQVSVLLAGSVKATSTHVNGVDTLLKIHGLGSLLELSALRLMVCGTPMGSLFAIAKQRRFRVKCS